MFRFLVFLSILVFSINIFAFEIKSISIADIHPTQIGAGFVSAEIIRNSKFSEGISESELRKKVGELKSIHGILGPDGIFFITDGHHRALAEFHAIEKMCQTNYAKTINDCFASVKVKVQIDNDLSKSSWDDFSHFMLKNNDVYLPPEIRKEIAKGAIPVADLFKNSNKVLPKNLGELKNDPMRTAMGSMLYLNKPSLNGDLFKNYLEFILIEKLNSKDKLPQGIEANDEYLKKLNALVFKNPEIVKTLRCHARADELSWKEAQLIIDQIVGIVRTKDEPGFLQSECVDKK